MFNSQLKSYCEKHVNNILTFTRKKSFIQFISGTISSELLLVKMWLNFKVFKSQYLNTNLTSSYFLISKTMYFLVFEGKKESEVAQSCPTVCNPMDCSPPGSSVHGIFQARVLEWVAISFSRGSSQPRYRTWIFHIAGRCFTF